MTENKATILAVDDEENNLKLLKMCLEDGSYEVLVARDGVEAINTLKSNPNITLVLLDKMMPNMDGLSVMKIMKSDPELVKIPVIMQTAAAEKQQIIAGIQSGVYYYLTKPYEEDLLLAIVKTAIEDYGNRRKLIEEAARSRLVIGLFYTLGMRVKTLNDAQGTAAFISNMFPEPEKVVAAICEFITNAIEHGNLEIDYNKKKELAISGKWKDEIDARLIQPQYRDKYAIVKFSKHDEYCELIIEDQGNGFDWKPYLELSADRATDPNGRGIATSIPAFKKVEYNEKGNVVTCIG